MWTFLRPAELYYALNRKEDETLCNHGDGVLKFKYVPVHHFKQIVMKVQRNRVRMEEECVWASFLRHKSTANENILERGSYGKCTSDMDTELKRLDDDNAPDKVKGVRKCAVRKSERGTTNTVESLLAMTSKDILPDRQVERRLFGNEKAYSEFNQDPSPRRVNSVSSPCTDSDPNCSKRIIYTRPNPQATYKILMMQRRVVELLDEISARLSRMPPPDSEIDLKRRQQRAVEFAARFTRNYLYNLSRCVADARRHTYSALSSVKMTTNRGLVALHMRAVEEKLIDAYQLLVHALIAYCKHIPCSVLKGSSGKLEDVLQVVTALQNICEETQLNTMYFGAGGDDDATSVGKDMLVRCTEILRKLRTKPENRPPIANSTCSLAARNKERSNSQKSKSKVDRYSMYTEKSRFKCHSKGKFDARRRRRPDTVTAAPEEKNGKLSADDGPSVDAIRNSAVRKWKLQNEDDVKTMMGMLTIDFDERIDLESCNSISTSTGERTKPTDKNTRYNGHVRDSKNLASLINAANHGENMKPNESFVAADKGFGSLVPVVAELMSLMKGEYEMKRKPASSIPLESVIGITQQDKSLRLASFVNGQPFGKTGRCNNNARLICPTTKQDVVTTVPARNCEVSGQTNYDKIETAAQQSVEERRNKGKPSAAGPTIRLTVPEKARKRIIYYRTEYRRLAELKSMYESKTQNKPWEIVAWISDKLVDELIVEIAKELEMNEVIQKLLDLEFRDC